jgi:hypothetical protein
MTSIEDAISSIEKEEAALEELFARLNSPSGPSIASPTTRAPIKDSVASANLIADSMNASASFPAGVHVQSPASSAPRAANQDADSTNASMSFPSGVQVEMPPPKGGLVSIKEEAVNDKTSPAPAQSKPVKTTPEKKPEARASEKALGKLINAALLATAEGQKFEYWWPLHCQCWGNNQCENCSYRLRSRKSFTQGDQHGLTETGPDSENLSPQAIEREYMLKAAEYVTSLPPDVGPTAELVKNVTAKLRRPYAPSAILEPDVVEILKARYVDAVVTFVGELHKGGKSISKDQVREILAGGEGNFLQLCAVLAEHEYISIDNLDQVCNMYLCMVSG